MFLIIYIYYPPPLTDQAATAAIAAGKRRKDLARSIASSSTSTGSSSGSGKRNHAEVKPTVSTKVTPEPKVPCVLGETVVPRQLDFGDGTQEGWV